MMNINGDYEGLLESSLKAELTWLEEELNMIFKQKKLKGSYTQNDISLGNKILDNVIEHIKSSKSEQLLNLLAITLNNIEHSFPDFF